MPERVYLGFSSHPVEEYLGPARRCYNCQRYGHLAKNCNGTRRCKICAEDYHHKDCKSIRQPKYANCNGPHAASFSGYPQNKAAAIQHRHDIIYGRKQQRGTPEPNMNTVNRTKPPRSQAPKRQDTSLTYTAKAARGLRNRDQSAGPSTSQQQIREKPQETPHLPTNPAATARPMVSQHGFDATVKGCVIKEKTPLNTTEKALMYFMASCISFVIVGSLTDIYLRKYGKEAGHDLNNIGTFFKVVLSFSAVANTEKLLNVHAERGSDAWRLRFLHGLRFLSASWVILGHSYLTIEPTAVGELLRIVRFGKNFIWCLVGNAYPSVQTFLFMR
ncbi:hypothetical protein HPB50_020931 [Hyalomma asiaticum]|uniref:Uncharacterized protein n=1 Tax=Hyalomma asiaticum TaxID=266040 RepID=A0ACB7TLE8_HYAAI|nr:hypothetical protein HPB50_020931 [Hyalomma asiaticum]